MSAVNLLMTGLLARLTAPLISEPTYGGPSTLTVGQTFLLTCRLSIFAPSQWTKDDKEVDFGLMAEVINDRNERVMTLRVASVSSQHQGQYRCNRWNRKAHTLWVISTDRGNGTEMPRFQVGAVLSLTEGRTHRLLCEIDSDEILPISWYKNEHPLTPRSGLRLEGPLLIIEKAFPSDAGRYTCGLTSNAIQKRWIIHLQHTARVIKLPLEKEILLGENLTLECKAFGYPSPQISWIVGNIKVPRSQMLQTQKNSLSLKIHGVEFAHRNLYTCRAENSLGADETSTFLKVKESTIETNAHDYTGIFLMSIGRPFTLQCNTTEDPDSNVIWFKDDRRIEVNGTQWRIFQHNNSLVIEKAEETHAGEYMCIAQASKIKKIITASIFVRKRRLSIWVESEENPNFAILSPGKNLTLHCLTEKRGVLWYKDGQLLISDHHWLFENNSLIIANGQPTVHTGSYMCVARATRFETISNATVFVATVPEVLPMRASLTIWEEESLEIHCRVLAGIPLPTVQWYKDSTELKEDDDYVTYSTDEKGVLRANMAIERVQAFHRGRYTCVADNGVRQFNVTILLRVKNGWASAWPLIGICIEIVILLVVVGKHERSRMEADVCQDTDSTEPKPSNISSAKTKTK